MSYILATEVVKNDTIIFTEDVYSGGYFNRVYVGKRVITAKVDKVIYNSDYITYCMDVIKCSGVEANLILEQQRIRRRDYKIFNDVVLRQEWQNELNRCILTDELYLYEMSNKKLIYA